MDALIWFKEHKFSVVSVSLPSLNLLQLWRQKSKIQSVFRVVAKTLGVVFRRHMRFLYILRPCATNLKTCNRARCIVLPCELSHDWLTAFIAQYG
jgi:hypothetical protein